MKTLPRGLEQYKKTPEFNETTVPAGLISDHSTKTGTWATITVLEGELIYKIMEPAVESHRLSPGTVGVIEPTIRHHLEIDGPVRFLVEFYR